MSASPNVPRILHLEDNPHDAELVLDLLESDGIVCELSRVRSRQEFEAAVSDASFDLVLTDFNIPNYDGLSALQFVREKYPALPVIVISGSLGEDAAALCARFGATEYLLKTRLNQLPSTVRRILQSPH